MELIEYIRLVHIIGYWVGVGGMWIAADGIASLWIYTSNDERAKGQTFWRDHSVRVVRCLIGIGLIIAGALLI